MTSPPVPIFGSTFGTTFSSTTTGGGTEPPPSGPHIRGTADTTTTPPRVALVIQAFGASARVTRTDATGTKPVRLAEEVLLSGGAWNGYDYEAPFGIPVSYSARLDNGTVLTSPAVTLNSPRPWLIHPGIPAMSRQVTFGVLEPRSYGIEQGTFLPLGSRYPVVVSGSRRAGDSSYSFYTATIAERNGLRGLLDSAPVVFLNVPPSLGYDIPTEYLAVGTVSEARVVRLAGDVSRMVTVPFTVVDRPAGGATSPRTWGDVLNGSSSWSAVSSQYPTWAGVLLNTVG